MAILPGVLVGRELVKQINLYVGQEVKVISPLGQNTLAGQTPYIKPYRVAGVFFTGMYEYDLKLIYVELSTLQDFLDLPDVVTGIEIRVEDPTDTESVVSRLRAELGPVYRIQDWKELNRSLFPRLLRRSPCFWCGDHHPGRLLLDRRQPHRWWSRRRARSLRPRRSAPPTPA